MPLFRAEKKKELRDEATKEYFTAAKKLLGEKREGRKKFRGSLPSEAAIFREMAKNMHISIVSIRGIVDELSAGKR